MNGWMGKILEINLSNHEQKSIPLDPEMIRKYLGGRGLGVKLYTDRVPVDIKPFAPENILIFMTGPLTGTVATSGRYQVISRSPLTGTIFDSSSGGRFGSVLKNTGYDGIIITGKSEKPVYLYLNEQKVEFRDATHIWGKDTHQTNRQILTETTTRASIACIGPAGENKVLFAAIMNDKDRAAGRGGMGAVMGSKNLKAIAVQGNMKVEIFDPVGLKEYEKKIDRLIDKNPVTGKSLPVLGTSVLVNLINAHGMYPTENFKRGIFNDAEGTSGEKLAETFLVNRSACYKCPIACGRKTRTSNKEGEGPEYETIWAFGAHLGVNNLEIITEANYLCNELGLDTITTGSTIGCAIELREKGVFDFPMNWGEADKILSLIEDIAFKKGVGEDLAFGSKKLAEKYGEPDLAMQVKGLEIPAYDPRGAQGQALSFATSNRGGCHMRGYIISPEIMGQPVFMDRYTINGKAEIVVLLQNISAFVDSLILCRFLQFAMGVTTFRDILNLITGIEINDEELLTVGERIYSLERLYNLKAGFTRKDDTLPPRFLHEPLEEGPSRNRIVDLDPMLIEYYQLRGWDKEGVPTKKTISRLELEF